MNKFIIIFLFCVIWFGLTQKNLFAFPTDFKGLPFDDGLQDSSFTRWRSQFLQAIEKKGTPFLLRALDPDIQTDKAIDDPPGSCPLEGLKGIKQFKIIWQDPKESNLFKPDLKLWEILKEILSHGAIRAKYESEGSIVFQAPYYHFFLQDNLTEAWTYYSVLIDKDVKLYKFPRKNAPVLRILSYEIVYPVYRPRIPEGWSYITLFTSKKKGYVEDKYLRYSGGYYSISCRKKNGEWKIFELKYYREIGCGG